MFTGLVEEVGQVVRVGRLQKGMTLSIRARTVLQGTRVGDSIAVSGVCLTVVRLTEDFFEVDVVLETQERSTLSFLRSGDPVNLERAMPATGRFGGHFVAGHVDAVGTVTGIQHVDSARVLTVTTDPALLRYVVEKGSIAIQGISLTVMDVTQDRFRVSIIPHTRSVTTLYDANEGTRVNIEVDMVGKYIEKLMHSPVSAELSGGLTAIQLREWGY